LIVIEKESEQTINKPYLKNTKDFMESLIFLFEDNDYYNLYSDTSLLNDDLDIRKKLSFNNRPLQNPYLTELVNTLRTLRLSSKNIKLLSVLDEIMNEPDDKSEEWWEDYFKTLKENKLEF